MLEIDCHLTKDGRVIVSHDSSLKRVCDSEGHIADYDFEVNINIHTCILKIISFFKNLAACTDFLKENLYKFFSLCINLK